MLGMARGLALILSRGIPIFGLSKEYLWIGQGKIFDVIPVPTMILLAVYRLGVFHRSLHPVRSIYLRHREQRRSRGIIRH